MKNSISTEPSKPVLDENDDNLNKGPDFTPQVSQIKQKRHKWTREEYVSILHAYFTATFYPKNESTTIHTYKIWRENNQRLDVTLDPNRLANLRRYILKTKKISEIEMEHLKERIHNENKANNKNINIENVDHEDRTNTCKTSKVNNKTRQNQTLEHIQNTDQQTLNQNNTNKNINKREYEVDLRTGKSEDGNHDHDNLKVEITNELKTMKDLTNQNTFQR